MSEPQIGRPGQFADRLASALDRVGSPACVGLDPVVERLPHAVRNGASDPVQAISRYSEGVLRAVAPHVAVVKFQSACFERYHAGGVAALGEAMGLARSLGLIVILDAKRGDIGISADHYAAAAYSAGADAITVSGYLGPDTIEPFLIAGRGVFVLVRTSNPGSDAVQSLRLSDGRSVAEMIADSVASLGSSRLGNRGLSDVGAVVGATKTADGAALRARMPLQVFLVPGYGAQGGTLDDCRSLVRPNAGTAGETGVLVTASRSVTYAFQPRAADWQHAVSTAASNFANELRALV